MRLVALAAVVCELPAGDWASCAGRFAQEQKRTMAHKSMNRNLIFIISPRFPIAAHNRGRMRGGTVPLPGRGGYRAPAVR